MRKTNIKQTLCGVFASLMLISALSGIAIAVGDTRESYYTIEQMDTVTLNREKVGAKDCVDSEEEELYNDDDLVTAIIVFDDSPVLDTAGTLRSEKSGLRFLTKKGKDIQSDIQKKQLSAIKYVADAKGAEVTIKYQYTLAFNGCAVTIPYGMLKYYKDADGVAAAVVSPEIEVPDTDFEVGTSMVSSGDMVGSYAAWETGYDGSGMLIAVLDTGLCVSHEAFQTAPSVVKYTKADIEKLFSDNDLLAEDRYLKAAGETLTPDMVYIREKIPFAFDYANRDCDVLQGEDDHGTHVAGIMAADPQSPCDLPTMEDMYIRGIAPKAQLCAMKVAGDTGGILWDNVIAALEDCIYIGVDVANLSFGEIHSFPGLEEYQEKMFDRMYEAGINVSVSSGNSYNSGISSTWNTSTNTTYNLENSMLSAPSVYRNVLSAASVNSTHAYYSDSSNENGYMSYMNIAGMQVMYFDSAPKFNSSCQFRDAFGGRDVEYVMIDGYGESVDYEGVDLQGRIAVVQRGVISFAEKHINAYNAGAAGLIIYDNISRVQVIALQIDDFRFPCVYVQCKTGAVLAENAVNGIGTLHVSDGNPVYTEASDAYEMSDFSSWGPLPNLTIKPEITAPGGNIVSTVDKNSKRGKGLYNYASESGTSMASPAVTASMAVIRQRVNELFPNLSPKEKADLVYALAMTTAHPTENDGVPYGVHRQGAGVINVADAVSTPAYITVDGQNHPKIELGDDPDRTGVYTLKFNVVNFGDKTVSYDISPQLIVPAYEYIDQGYRAAYVQIDGGCDCTSMMTFTSNMPDNRVTLSAGEKKSVTVTITVNDEFRALMSEVFKYGSYVEGYCRLLSVTDSEGIKNPNLSVCYLGYYGSWCECPVVDQGFYYDDWSDNLSCMSSPNTAGSKQSTLIYYELGVNPYYEWTDEFTFLMDRCSISPENNDSMFDSVDYFLTGVMRNLSKFYYRVYDPQTGEIYYEKELTDVEKNSDSTLTSTTNPMGQTINKMKSWKGDKQAEGQTLMIRCGGEGLCDNWDDGKAPYGYWEVPVTLDNTPPYVVESHSSGTKLYITVSDAHYTAYIGLYDTPLGSEDETPEAFAEFCVCENERGAQTTVEVDMTGRESAYLLVGDYAANEAQFKITHTGSSEPDPTPTPTPTNEPVNTGVSYQLASSLGDNDTYCITARVNGVYYALTDAVSENGGIQGARINVVEKNSRPVIEGYASKSIEWTVKNGILTNEATGLQLTAGDTLTLSSEGTQWLYEVGRMTSNGKMLGYANSEFNLSGTSNISVFRRVTPVKNAQAVLTTVVRVDGSTLYTDIAIKSSERIASGILTLGYDPDMMDFDKVARGDMLDGAFLQINDIIPGEVTIAFASSDYIEADGSCALSPQFTLKGNIKNGTILIFELTVKELLLDDTTTEISSEASGADYIVGSANPTPTPTQEPTPTPTQEPTPTPTQAPTPTQEPTPTPTQEPTPTPTVVPTMVPTTPPTETPTPTTPPTPPITGDRMGGLSLCLAVFGISGIGYFIVRRKADAT